MSIIFDVYTLNQVRADADAHNVDLARCKITQLSDGEFNVAFDAPLVSIDRYLPDHPSQITTRSAASAEGHMLMWATKIQVAERRAVRTGTVGWDSVQISRTPISSAELDAYRARQREVELQRRVARELLEAVEQRQREANQAAAADLAQRYPGVVGKPTKAPKKPAQVAVQDKSTAPRIMQ
ncbi:hypothetical protein [Pseudomonas putida]|uniref:hypothetical protein n=1 Tax=Pseudomonas putida TaxID=303 RepID=UPI00384F1211